MMFKVRLCSGTRVGRASVMDVTQILQPTIKKIRGRTKGKRKEEIHFKYYVYNTCAFEEQCCVCYRKIESK